MEISPSTTIYFVFSFTSNFCQFSTFLFISSTYFLYFIFFFQRQLFFIFHFIFTCPFSSLQPTSDSSFNISDDDGDDGDDDDGQVNALGMPAHPNPDLPPLINDWDLAVQIYEDEWRNVGYDGDEEMSDAEETSCDHDQQMDDPLDPYQDGSFYPSDSEWIVFE